MTPIKSIMLISFILMLAGSCGNPAEGIVPDETETSDKFFRPFYGVESTETGYHVIAPGESVTKAHLLAATTIYYGIPLRFEEGIVSIPDTCFNDLNLLYNITIKSSDSVWFEEHIAPGNK